MANIASSGSPDESQADAFDENKDASSAILSPTRLLTSKTSTEFVSFSWNIDAFDCLVTSDVLIRSQTFKFLQKNQFSEWYLSLEYSPHRPGHLRTGIFLTTVNTKQCAAAAGEVKAMVSVFLTDPDGRPTLDLGSINRVFKAKDPALLFRRFLKNEALIPNNETRSESHEWLEPIGLKQLWGNKDILLSDNTLRIRCFLSVETMDITARKSQRFQNSSITKSEELTPPVLSDVGDKPYKVKTYISEHSTFNDYVVQNSDHSPYGSTAFRSRRPQTAHASTANAQRYYAHEELMRQISDVKATKETPNQRPYTAVDVRKIISKGHDRKYETSSQMPISPQQTILPERPKSPYHGRRTEPKPKLDDRTTKNLAIADRAIERSRRVTNSQWDNRSGRPKTRRGYQSPEIISDDERDLDSSNTDCAIICGGRKFNVHTEILKRSSPIFATVLQAATGREGSTTSSVPIITTDDVDPAVMRKMLNYVYSGEVDIKQLANQDSERPSKLTIGASRKLLHAAQKYQISNLKEECLARLMADLSLETVGDIAVLAHEFNANSKIQNKIRAFLRSKWIVLQRSSDFRELYKRNPGAFVGVFQINGEDGEADE